MQISKKFIPPACTEPMVERKDLNVKFDNASAKGNILVSAQAGYGKSMAVLSWLKSAGHNFAWLNIDEMDNTLANFCLSMVKTLRHGAEPEDKPGFEQTPFEYLLRTATLSKSEENFLLVLDDFHLITNKNVLMHFYLFLKRISPQWRIIMISQAAPPNIFIEMILKEDLFVIESQDLSFNLAEIDFFFTRKGQPLSDERLREIKKITEGWAVAVNLLTRLPASKTDLKWIDRYFREKFWLAYPQRLKIFLLSTSFMEIIDPVICDSVLGLGYSQNILDTIKNGNSFVKTLPNGKIQYHYLFRNFLAKAWDECATIDKNRLFLKYADYLCCNGHIPSAMDFYLRAGEYNQAIHLTERYNFVMEDFSSVMLRHLPPAAHKEPRLMLILAWAYLAAGDAAKMEFWLNCFEKWSGEWPEDFQNNAKLICFHAFLKAMYPKKKRSEMIFIFKSCLKNLPASPEKFPLNIITHNLPSLLRGGIDYSALLPEFNSFMKEVCPVFKIIWGDEYGIWENILLAEAAYEKNDLSLSHELIKQTIEQCRGYRSEFFFIALCLLCLIQYALKQKNKSAKTLARLQNMVKNEKAAYFKKNFAAFYTVMKLKDKDISAAEIWLHKYAPKDDKLLFCSLFQYFASAKAYIATGKFTEAADFLNMLEELCKTYHRDIDLAEVYILKSVTYLKMNEDSSSLDAMCAALELGARYGFVRIFLDNQETKAILERLLAKTDFYPDFNKRYVKKLVSLLETQRISPNGIAGEIANIKLSVRQRNMLLYLSQNLSYDEITEKTNLKITTVRTHISNLYKKLEATHKKEALEKARKLGFIEKVTM